MQNYSVMACVHALNKIDAVNQLHNCICGVLHLGDSSENIPAKSLRRRAYECNCCGWFCIVM